MKEVTIIVRNGRVDEVYGSDKDIYVTVIDLDEQNPQLLEQLEADVADACENQHLLY